MTLLSRGWNRLAESYSHAWHLGWYESKAGLSWDRGPEYLHVDSPCILGFSQHGSSVVKVVSQMGASAEQVFSQVIRLILEIHMVSLPLYSMVQVNH